MRMGIGTEIVILVVFGKDDIKIELQFSNVIYTSNMNLNLFSFMMIYDRGYEI
jgi:hypothetical protein